MTEEDLSDLWGRVTEMQGNLLILLCNKIDIGPLQGIINAQIEALNRFPPVKQISMASMLQKIIQQLEKMRRVFEADREYNIFGACAEPAVEWQQSRVTPAERRKRAAADSDAAPGTCLSCHDSVIDTRGS